MAQRWSQRAKADSSSLGFYLDEMGGIPLLPDGDVVRLASGLIDARRAIATSAQALPPSCRAIALAGDESGPALGAAWPLADVETFFRKLPRARSARIVAKLRAHKRALDQARDGLVRGNLRLVVHVARKYVNRGLPLIDLIQDGNIGLLRAVEKFEHERGNKFSTYAYWWVKQSIERGLTEKTRSIRVPVHVVGRMRQVGFASRDLMRRLGRKPTTAEIAALLGLPVDAVERTQSVVREPTALEHPPGDPTGLDLTKILPDDNAPSPYEEALKRQLGRRLDAILARLNPREEEIVRLRFGIGHGDTRTLEQIGRKLRITRERVRQIESIALSKLKRSVQSRELAGLYGISA